VRSGRRLARRGRGGDRRRAAARIPAGVSDPPTLAAALSTFARIGVLSFGGPAGQIAIMHRILVDEKKWIDEARFLKALNFCMALPGPEAQQLATYVGLLLHKTPGAIAAGLLFILPGALVMLALSALYAAHRDAPLIAGVFFGVKAAVVAIVFEALLRIARRGLKSPAARALAAAAFVAIFFFAAPFPAIVIAAAIIGAASARAAPGAFPAASAASAGPAPPPLRLADFRSAAGALLFWLAPLAALVILLPPGHVFAEAALFFSKMAVVTFGGAYAVLAYVAQEAVATYGWLAPGEMLDGLGLAETTPGPLVLVLEFVGFIAGWRGQTGLAPLLGGAVGALIAVWFTFAPCFFWIFLGAPFLERLGGARAVNAGLAAVTAAVVGVVANLALWFSVHVVFREVGEARVGPLRVAAPDPMTLDLAALALVALAAAAIFRARFGLVPALGFAALAGAALDAAGLI
jgi:chromate transporter